MALLTQQTLAQYLNLQSVLDANRVYVAQVIADVQDMIQGYLGYDPVLQVVVNEEGIVTYIQSGPYVGRYGLRLAVSPLVPGLAPAIFNNLQLTYGLSNLPNAAVGLGTTTVLHATGQVFTLAPGAVEALTWQYGLTPGVQAVGYIASYVGGYATGINDPVPNGGGTGFTAHAVLTNGVITSVVVDTPGTGYTSPPLLVLSSGNAVLQANLSGLTVGSVTVVQGDSGYVTPPTIAVSSAASFNAPPMSPAITAAAVLLCRERLAADSGGNSNIANPSAGAIASVKTRQQQVVYQGVRKWSGPPLGFGTTLAQAAAARLDPWRRAVLPVLV